MDCDFCGDHTDQVTKVKSFTLVVKVFGSMALGLLMWLILSVSSTSDAMNDYKLESARITSGIELSLARISSDARHTKDDISEIKNMLRRERIFAETQESSSILLVKDFER